MVVTNFKLKNMKTKTIYCWSCWSDFMPEAARSIKTKSGTIFYCPCCQADNLIKLEVKRTINKL